MASGKEVVFSTHGNGADRVFYQIVVDFQPAVEEELLQIFPAFKRVGDRTADQSGASG